MPLLMWPYGPSLKPVLLLQPPQLPRCSLSSAISSLTPAYSVDLLKRFLMFCHHPWKWKAIQDIVGLTRHCWEAYPWDSPGIEWSPLWQPQTIWILSKAIIWMVGQSSLARHLPQLLESGRQLKLQCIGLRMRTGISGWRLRGPSR